MVPKKYRNLIDTVLAVANANRYHHQLFDEDKELTEALKAMEEELDELDFLCHRCGTFYSGKICPRCVELCIDQD